jgi:hypothetical protein
VIITFSNQAPAQAQGFDRYISPTGDDNNSGSYGAPWSASALNNNAAAYPSLRVGFLPGLYLSGTKGGVQTSIYAMYQAIGGGPGANPGAANALNINGGAPGNPPTFVGSSDQNGNYSPRQAILSAANIITGARPTSENGFLGQAYQVCPNKGNLVIDGLVLQHWNQWGIAIYPQLGGAYPPTLNTLVRVQNCEIFDGAGNENDNMAGLVFQQQAGAYAGNNKIHGIIPSSGNVTLQDCVGILSFGCNVNLYEHNTIYNVNTGIYDKNSPNGSQTHRYNLIEMIGPAASNAALTDCMGGLAADTYTAHHNVLYVPGAAPNNGAVWNGRSVVQPQPQSVVFYNNTVLYGSDNAPGLFMQACSGRISSFNNIVVCIGVHASSGLITAYSGAYVGIIDYNTYDDLTHAPNFGLASAANNAIPPYLQLAGWKTSTGKEANSEIATPVFAGALGVQNAANYQLTGTVGVMTGKIGGVAGGGATNRGALDGTGTPGCNF